jgi:hypothetical protein
MPGGKPTRRRRDPARKPARLRVLGEPDLMNPRPPGCTCGAARNPENAAAAGRSHDEKRAKPKPAARREGFVPLTALGLPLNRTAPWSLDHAGAIETQPLRPASFWPAPPAGCRRRSRSQWTWLPARPRQYWRRHRRPCRRSPAGPFQQRGGGWPPPAAGPLSTRLRRGWRRSCYPGTRASVPSAGPAHARPTETRAGRAGRSAATGPTQALLFMEHQRPRDAGWPLLEFQFFSAWKRQRTPAHLGQGNGDPSTVPADQPVGRPGC